MAVVQVVDEEGDVLPHSAETIFSLTPETSLTIQGKASVDEFGFLVVRLSGLYAHP